MEKEKNTKQKEISVPLDVMMDIAAILAETEIEHKITAINANKSTVQIALVYPKEVSYYQKAVDNIDAILSEYRHFRLEEEDGDWRDY